VVDNKKTKKNVDRLKEKRGIPAAYMFWKLMARITKMKDDTSETKK